MNQNDLTPRSVNIHDFQQIQAQLKEIQSAIERLSANGTGNEQWLRIADLKKEFSLSEGKIWAMRKKEGLKSYPMGKNGRPRFKRSDVERFLESCENSNQ